jgi:protein-tyrosine kinase
VEQFTQAVNLARGIPPSSDRTQSIAPSDGGNAQAPHRNHAADTKFRSVALSKEHLESMRIVSFSKDNPHSRSFDMLRTQVLQSMDNGGWQIVAVTSATPGCGKTVTACNLALSIARLPERSVLLVDMDFRKPKVADYLGLRKSAGLFSVLEGRQTLIDAIVQVGTTNDHLLILPGESAKSSSELMSSPAMDALLQTMKREFRSRIIILDLPPILAGDDVISILPKLQSVLLVAAAGSTSLADIKECNKHLNATPVVKVVVNKITEPDTTNQYYDYY